ncbi:MAG TPA: response regulator [Verrucomicrobiae bacterium]|nr:response regulator [Verrucomicrobiae bacterium]
MSSRTCVKDVSGSTEARTGESRRRIVLVVEDEASVRQYTAVALERLGYQVFKAANAKAALEMVGSEELKVDLLLTDLLLPEMDGRELAKALRDRFPRMKVLYLSGYTAAAAIRQGVLDVGSPFLQKPFELSALTKQVRALLGQE